MLVWHACCLYVIMQFTHTFADIYLSLFLAACEQVIYECLYRFAPCFKSANYQKILQPGQLPETRFFNDILLTYK